MDKIEFKSELYELFDGGGTNGGLFIDADDAEMLYNEILELVKKLNLAGVSKSLPLTEGKTKRRIKNSNQKERQAAPPPPPRRQ